MGASDVTDSIGAFVDAVNRGDQAAAVAHFTGDVTIIEDLAPFRWQGPNAGPEWMLAMWDNAQRNNISAIVMEISRPVRVEVEDGAAYAVVPGLLTYHGDGSARRAEGTLTFALKASAGTWLISALVWSGPAAI